jgi:F0F1-type ATP synthase assembly protein I
MPEQPDTQDRLTVLWLLGLQVLLIVLAGASGLLVDDEASLSILLGGAIGFAGNCWMALVIFRPVTGSTPQRLVWGLYVGEAGKFLFIMAFFAIAFRKVGALAEPRNAMLLFASFVANQMIVWLWPVFAGAGLKKKLDRE